jgi:hypothetical protein
LSEQIKEENQKSQPDQDEDIEITPAAEYRRRLAIPHFRKQFHLFSGQQIATEDRHRLAHQDHAISLQADFDNAATTRCLVRCHLSFPQLLRPVRREGAVSGAGNWVLINAGAGREKTGNEIELAPATGGRNDATHGQFAEQMMLRRQSTQGLFVSHFHQIVELIPADVNKIRPERFGQAGRRFHGLF